MLRLVEAAGGLGKAGLMGQGLGLNHVTFADDGRLGGVRGGQGGAGGLGRRRGLGIGVHRLDDGDGS